MEKKKNRYEELFDSFLNMIGFQLVKYPDGWELIDQEGANLGDIESERSDNAVILMDGLDIYIQDYFVSDIEEALGSQQFKNWEDMVEAAKEKLDSADLKECRFELDILDMICCHPTEVNLENCNFIVRSCP